jgi:5-methylcytosine-specific restriction enzyme A
VALARPCLDCGELTGFGSRCPRHQAARERKRGTRTERGLDNDWLRLRDEAILRQPWCSYCGASEDLTAARAESGAGTSTPMIT